MTSIVPSGRRERLRRQKTAHRRALGPEQAGPRLDIGVVAEVDELEHGSEALERADRLLGRLDGQTCEGVVDHERQAARLAHRALGYEAGEQVDLELVDVDLTDVDLGRSVGKGTGAAARQCGTSLDLAALELLDASGRLLVGRAGRRQLLAERDDAELRRASVLEPA